MRKSYSELITIPDYKDRYLYLQLNSKIGVETFGHDRYLNQILYTSSEWRRFRNQIILRDNGHDMAMPDLDYEISGWIIVHHINPITIEDVLNRNPYVFDPDNVVCVSDMTHKAIHYGDISLLMLLRPEWSERRPNDTIPWKM